MKKKILKSELETKNVNKKKPFQINKIFIYYFC